MKKSVLGQFGIIFIPSALIVIGIVSAIFYQESRDELEQMQLEEIRLLKLHERTIIHEFKMIVSDLRNLSAHDHFHTFLDEPSESDRQALAGEFLAFSAFNGMYDQVRYLDATGMEVIRIDYNDGNPVIVPETKLQSKGDRYYFTKAFRLNRGEVFVSPFDLNVENGEVERPLKPVIRIAMPMFDKAGQKKGVLILNYLGRTLFRHIDAMVKAMNSRASILLLDREGYWLKGLKPEDEWGFMFKDETRTFGRAFPQVWGRILGQQTDQLRSPKGLFSFATIYPLIAGLPSLNGSIHAAGGSPTLIGDNDYFWKLVVYVPEELLTENARKMLWTMLPFLVAFIVFLAIGAFFIARANVRRAVDEENIEKLAHFDMLTGLPNRALLYDRLGRLIARQERQNQSFALMFVDLDGFKAVNDTHGHEAGDMVLVETASRIRGHIREMDTAGRIGGDEFLIVITDVKQAWDVQRVAEKLISVLGKPFLINESAEVSIGASIGISIHPDDGHDIDTLIKYADKAMYDAKNSGKNSLRFHTREPARRAS